MLDHEFCTEYKARHVLNYWKKLLGAVWWKYFKRDFAVLESCGEGSEDIP